MDPHQQLGDPFDTRTEAQPANIAAVWRDEGHQIAPSLIVGVAQRRAVIASFDGVDSCSTFDQKLRNARAPL
jgi:hypothetical protein